MVDSNQQFAEHAGSEQLYTDQDEQNTEHQQRAPADVVSKRELVESKICERREADEHERDPDAVEGMHGPVQKAQQKLDP